jgi:hypothetical protein
MGFKNLKLSKLNNSNWIASKDDPTTSTLLLSPAWLTASDFLISFPLSAVCVRVDRSKLNYSLLYDNLTRKDREYSFSFAPNNRTAVTCDVCCHFVGLIGGALTVSK